LILDRSVTLTTGNIYYASVQLIDGSIERIQIDPALVDSTPKTTITFVGASSLTQQPMKEGTFIIDGPIGGEMGTLWRVVSVTEPNVGEYAVTALQHDKTKYNRIDFGYVTNPLAITSYDDSVIGPVSNIAHTAESYFDGTTQLIRLSITWNAPTVGVASKYKMMVSFDGSPFTDYGLWYSENGFIEHADNGTYIVKVFAISATGKKSPKTKYTFVFDVADVMLVPEVKNLRVEV